MALTSGEACSDFDAAGGGLSAGCPHGGSINLLVYNASACASQSSSRSSASSSPCSCTTERTACYYGK